MLVEKLINILLLVLLSYKIKKAFEMRELVQAKKKHTSGGIDGS